MDIFTDKLAQRATAQEIIKANTAADVEELNKLKYQIMEYNECLERLQKLTDEGTARLAKLQAEDSRTGSLVQESLNVLKELRQTGGNIRQSQTKMGEQLADLEEVMNRHLKLASDSLEEKLEGLKGLTEEQLTERLSTVEDNVHKECVKVYRNVQAVVTEESGKQGESTETIKTEMSALKAKMGTVLGFSIAALLVSAAGIVLQILDKLGVLPF